MKKTSWIAIGLVTVVGFAGWARKPSVTERVPLADSHRMTSELDSPKGESSSDVSEEVARLRAELRRKDALLLSLASAQKDLEQRLAKEVTTPTTSETHLTPGPVEILDERMYSVPRDARKATEMEREVKEVANIPELGEAKVSSVYCGSTLCKITLSAETDAVVNASMAALAGRLPKTFGAAAVYEVGKGQSAMYVAKSSQELDITPTGS